MSHGGGKDRWLVSYADFITLLMVLFVVLYSMSQVDVEKYKLLANSLRVAFSGDGETSVVDPSINLGGGLSDSDSAAPIIIPGIPHVSMDSVEVASQLTNMLQVTDQGDMVSVQNNLEGVLISLSEKLIFMPGTAELQPDAYAVLDTVATMLKSINNEVRIVGYTDSSPIADPRYTNSWELSTARAITIVNYLASLGLDPARFTASGRGEYHPLFSDDSEEHRLLNSRAEIIVVYPIEEETIDLGFFDESIVDPNDLAIESTGE